MSKWHERPILFLDVDGVLNSHDYMRRGGSLSCKRDGIDAEAVKHLQRIVDESKCSIILSSTWRLMFSLSDMRGKLIAKGMRGPVPLRGKTPDLAMRGRGVEVNAWIASAGFKAPYAILDDDGDFLPGQPLVQTNYDMGLTADHADRCIRLLTSPEQRSGDGK